MTVYERKTLNVDMKGRDDGQIEAVFSTFVGADGSPVVDHDLDVTLPTAFADRSEVIIGAYGHSNAMPIGKGTIQVNQVDARIAGRLFVDTSHGETAYKTLKGLGGLAQWSYQYSVEKARPDTVNGQRVRVLEKIKVYSVDPVLAGAGVNTRTTRIKRRDDELSEEEIEAREYLRSVREKQAREPAERELVRQAIAEVKRNPYMYPYPEVAEADVAERVVRAARLGVKLAAEELDIPEPRLKWFARGPLGSASRLGYTQLGEPGVVRVKCTLTARQAIEVAAHETAHVSGRFDDHKDVFAFGESILRMVWADDRLGF